MILVTVGTQLPFDRLVKAMDQWAAAHPQEMVEAQIGTASYIPQNMVWHGQLTMQEFRLRYEAASLIVSHAGIGNILLALEMRKPIIVMPRRAVFGEHRNDHQIATVKWFKDKAGILVVEDEAELDAVLASADQNVTAAPFSQYASPELLETVRNFVEGRESDS